MLFWLGVRYFVVTVLVVLAVVFITAAACGEEKPAPGGQYCIVEGHALRQAIGPDPRPSDPHDVPRRPCTAADLKEASPRP